MANPYSTAALNSIIGLIKTLQHGGKLTGKEKLLFSSLIDTEQEWFAKLEELKPGETVEPLAMFPNGTWSDPLDFISCGLPKGKVRVALKSMRSGNPTFLDQEIAKEFVDSLFQMYHAVLLEEEAIGRVY